MKTKLQSFQKIFLVLLLVLTSGLGWGQATLPISNVATTASSSTLPSGFTASGLGLAYANAATPLKFDNTGDSVILFFTGTGSTLTYKLTNNSFSGGTYTVSESTDGSTYTAINTVTSITSTQSYSHTINTNTRYIKWVYTSRVNGNVGLGTIGLTAITGFNVTYNGNGNTSGSAPTDASSPYAASSTVTVLGNTGSLVKTGYLFDGWNTLANGSGTSYVAGNTFTISANTTLYAKWLALTAPTVTTTTATAITSYTASSGGNVTADGGATVTARGVVYGLSANPTLANSVVTTGSGTGSYTSSLTSLSPLTQYYYRAYATNSVNTSYGAESSFTTLSDAITSAQTGNWSDTSTWVGGVVPSVSDKVLILSGHTVTAGAITRNSGTTTTVNVGGTLAVTGAYTNDGTTTINGSFQLNGGGWATGANNLVYGSTGTLFLMLLIQQIMEPIGLQQVVL
jgi:uncharacterized repeat protein (TIGR02543 family)